VLCEILFKVGNSGVGNTFDIKRHYLDGMPIAIKPTGILVTSAEWLAWLDADASRPVQVAELPDNRQLSFDRLVARVRAVLDGSATLATICAERFPELPMGGSEGAEKAQQVIDGLLDVHTKIQAQDWDSNWGFEEVKNFGVMIADVPYGHMESIVIPPSDPDLPKFKTTDTWAQRGSIVPYTEILSGGSLVDIQTPGVQVPVARGEIPIAYEEVLVKLNKADY